MPPFCYSLFVASAIVYLLTVCKVRTEDDVLYIPTLPDFNNALGQQDAELLISFLTVPYIRIPLMVQLPSCPAAVAPPHGPCRPRQRSNCQVCLAHP